jgi:N-acetylmuramoyl-L-alanine amidase
VFYVLPIYETYQTQWLVILDPSGDVKRTGRKIGDNFERGLTLQCAEKIKEYIEQHAPYIKVIITRMPGDTIYDLQNASLSNRLQADLFVNLNFYHSQETKPTLFLYQFSYGNDFACCNQSLTLRSYDEAYKINKQITDEMLQLFKASLSQHTYQSMFTVAGIYALPIKPLIGIVAPSVCIEMGLKNKESWINYVEPLAQSIIGVLE